MKQIERSLRQSQYQVDADILNKINQGLKFEIKNVRTLPLEDESQKIHNSAVKANWLFHFLKVYKTCGKSIY